MKVAKNISCPVDYVKVNENRVRANAFIIMFITIGIIYTSSIYLIIFLVVDFFQRAFNYSKWSLINNISGIAINYFKISEKPVDGGPKRFAAKVGFVIAGVILIFKLLSVTFYPFALLIVFFLPSNRLWAFVRAAIYTLSSAG